MARRALEQAKIKLEKFFKAENLMSETTIFRINKPGKIINYMESNNYDLAILKNDNKYNYVLLNDIEKDKTFDKIPSKIIKNIEVSQKININSSIDKVINRFEHCNYLFVFNKTNEVKGLITYADLNDSPVYAFCYIIISEFEKILRKVIKIKFEEDNWLSKLSDKQQRKIREIYISEKEKGVEHSLLDYTTIHHLKNILQNESSWIASLSGSYISKKDFRSKIQDVAKWRNKVMHFRNLISNKNGGKVLFNFIKDVGQQMKDIQEWIKENND
jgi:hypothetical protein